MPTPSATPASFPYTRGVQPNMYRGRVWTMRQYAGYATAAATNERYRYLLENGQTGLSVAFDLPTQIGYDSDHPLAEGEVGKVGVPICSLGRHGDPVRWHPPRPGQHVHDHQRHRRRPAVPLHRRRQEAGRLSRPAQRDPAERHPQGVHRPRHLCLPAPPVHAPRGRRVQVLRRECAPLEHHQHQRLPHAGGRRHRQPGVGLHLRQRYRLRAGRRRRRTAGGRLCPAAVFLLRGSEQPIRRGCQVPRRPPDCGRT